MDRAGLRTVSDQPHNRSRHAQRPLLLANGTQVDGKTPVAQREQLLTDVPFGAF
jgi:hypothetical protein